MVADTEIKRSTGPAAWFAPAYVYIHKYTGSICFCKDHLYAQLRFSTERYIYYWEQFERASLLRCGRDYTSYVVWLRGIEDLLISIGVRLAQKDVIRDFSRLMFMHVPADRWTVFMRLTRASSTAPRPFSFSRCTSSIISRRTRRTSPVLSRCVRWRKKRPRSEANCLGVRSESRIQANCRVNVQEKASTSSEQQARVCL